MPYEPPKPPQEYEWGDKVEVYEDGAWHEALYIHKSDQFNDHWCSRKDQTLRLADYEEENIRPCPTPPPSDCLAANTKTAREYAQHS